MTANPDKAERVRRMFGRIVPRYDRINSLMTFGMDHSWRSETVRLVAPADSLSLDIATGTGELALELCRQGARMVVAVDFCPEMLTSAVQKTREAAPAGRIVFANGDAMCLPFADDTFDRIVNGFMLRNVVDLPGTFRELLRVLKPGGRIACLDITHAQGPLRGLIKLYVNTLVPRFGGVLSGDYPAYKYLADSLSPHPDAPRLAQMMRDAGFSEVSYELMGLGVAAVHLGTKPQ